jgi:hypothetical protein
MPGTHIQEQREVRARVVWFGMLLASICFEGLARKVVPALPPSLFYFLKDVVLIGGALQFGLDSTTHAAMVRLFRGFPIWLGAGIVVTLLQVFNPDHASMLLGFIGVRAYWLWWLAPVVVAGLLGRGKVLRGAIAIIIGVSLVVAAFAIVQFDLPSDDPLNAYAWSDTTTNDVATVLSTGRVRVTSTFSYLSGFTNFVILIPPLLLAFGLEQTDKRLRNFCFVGMAAVLSAGATSGSRAVLVWSAVTLPLVLGLRRILRRGISGLALPIALVLAGAFISSIFFPDALSGVLDRFEQAEESQRRVTSMFAAFPPVALLSFDYPFFGIGTGMQLNARWAFGIPMVDWDGELEPHRMLIEFGAVGYLIVWMSRLGLIVALARAHLVLAARKMDGMSGLALAMIPLAAMGQIATDHLFQALFFLNVSFVLASIVHAEHNTSQLESDYTRLG